MVRFVSNPPNAAALMTSARSFGNYDLASALADLIDNSIKARARVVRLHCDFNDGDPEIRVIDDGHGMSCTELHAAMRPASTDPREKRSADDLGRFGWGLKSASLSQCTYLTVISKRDEEISGASWNLNDLDGWKMGVLSRGEIAELAPTWQPGRNGTEIIWRNCDRLSENGTLTLESFNELIVYARNRIALVFHNYLSGTGPRRLQIKLNGLQIEAYDPFYREHTATQQLELEELRIGRSKILIQPFILPHYSKLKLAEYDQLGGEEGFLHNQGFYVYRNHRLLMHGTWFRLAKYGELSQLVRISVEFPNSLDDVWKITLDKSDAQLPAALRKRLQQIVDRMRSKSSKVLRSKGGNIDSPGVVSVWTRHARKGEIQYSINREHPVVASVLQNEETRAGIETVIKTIEQTFPVAEFAADASDKLEGIHQTETNPREFILMLETALPNLLGLAKGDMNQMIDKLRQTEPFCQSWPLVEGHLREKGWLHD